MNIKSVVVSGNFKAALIGASTGIAVSIQLSAILFAHEGCNKPSPPNTQAQNIYAELVEAGCLQADDSGLATVQSALQFDGATPSWFTCLANGGTVSSCQLPCDSAISPTSVKVIRQ